MCEEGPESLESLQILKHAGLPRLARGAVGADSRHAGQ